MGEKNGFSQIKANMDDYEMPKKFSKPGEDEPYIPDITGFSKGGKCYVEIAQKSDDVTRMVAKWKLFSTLAGMKKGKLFLLAPKGHKAFTDKLIKQFSIEATVYSI